MFPLLLDCLEFFFSYLSYFKDDQLSLLCRAIASVSIALGGYKNGRNFFWGQSEESYFSRVVGWISAFLMQIFSEEVFWLFFPWMCNVVYETSTFFQFTGGSDVIFMNN